MRPFSVLQPLTPTIQRCRRILFEPFRLSKWLRLGFWAFLAGATPGVTSVVLGPGGSAQRSVGCPSGAVLLLGVGALMAWLVHQEDAPEPWSGEEESHALPPYTHAHAAPAHG